MAPSSPIRVVPAAGPAARGVGKYRYIAMLAEGGMADVYLAVTRGAGFEKLVVIKQMRPSLASDPTLVTMFRNEAGLAARLNHPNVVQTHEVGVEEGVPFLAMEFLEGVPYVRLARLRDRVPAPLAFHVRVLADVLHGLHYAHELRDYGGAPLEVVHRDVSPHNVMITFAGVVKVVDFGIAKALLAAELRPGDFKGKLEYMAPEQARREPVDRRADLFAVGVMLWEALARRRLFMPGEKERYDRLVSGDLPPILSVRPDAPPRLAQICTQAMAHAAQNRHATALVMADDLEEWLDGTTHRVSAREVGAYVSEKFASTRSRLGLAIDAQLEAIRSLPEGAEGAAPLAHIPFTEVPPAMASEPPAGFYPLAPLTEPSWTGSGASAPGGSAASGGSWSRAPVAVSPPAARAGAPSASVLALALMAGVVLALGGWGFAVARKARAAAAPVASAAPAERASASPSASGEPRAAGAVASAASPALDVEISVQATPPDARIWIDGQPMTGNPATVRRPRDAAMHVVRVEAVGHGPRDVQLGFDRSVLVTVDLRPSPPALPPSASASGSSPRPSARPPATRRPWPPGAPRPRGPKALDTENPYQ